MIHAASGRTKSAIENGGSMPRVTGRVYDLDAISNLGWCQAGVSDGRTSVATMTADIRLQKLLTAAFTSISALVPTASITYVDGDPSWITGILVQFERSADPKAHVWKLQIGPEDGICLVTLSENGQEVKLKTTEHRIESILETAAALGKSIEYMSEGGWLTRAKVNFG
jgi:hypothetical protein